MTNLGKRSLAMKSASVELLRQQLAAQGLVPQLPVGWLLLALQQQALARAHALAARLQRGSARHAGAPEEHAQTGVKRGGEEMK